MMNKETRDRDDINSFKYLNLDLKRLMSELEEFSKNEGLTLTCRCKLQETTLTSFTGEYILITTIKTEKNEYTSFLRLEWFEKDDNSLYYRSIVEQIKKYELNTQKICSRLVFITNKVFDNNQSIISLDEAIKLYSERLDNGLEAKQDFYLKKSFINLYNECIFKIEDREYIQLYDIADILA